MRSLALPLLTLCLASQTRAAPQLKPQRIRLAGGPAFSLYLPQGYRIVPAAQGLKRPRFFALSPDNRIFVTEMHNKSDNSLGAITILEGFDSKLGQFSKITRYLTGLRNPNSVAFWRDDKAKQTYLYVALTDKLLRYPYNDGDSKPSGPPETIATFPATGLSYKYGGWHLTRTIAVAPPSVAPEGKIYVSVGSSGDALIEKEEVRATVLEMNPDGSQQKVWAKGLRNAVGLKWFGKTLYATNQGSDHLGDNRPSETFYALRAGADYGWPYAYQSGGKIRRDPKFSRPQGIMGVPLADAAFPAHSSALGFEWFGAETQDSVLRNRFMVALHGSGFTRLKRGYSLVTVQKGRACEPFLTGFLCGRRIYGRPCDILKQSDGSFFFSDDFKGVIYYVTRK
jgi:glucose/arabinose dehydrogenase